MKNFLRARLDEDEAMARALKPGKNQSQAKLQARVLADVEAKRRIMDWVEEMPRLVEGNEGGVFWKRAAVEVWAGLSQDFRSPPIRALVAAYDGHRDFHPEWRLAEDEYELREDTPVAHNV
ncbi:DUF6221 family protein [Streptomyces sp. NPDC060194]|uniref:DUF6221 family protein n=1 Tax=Streptomyces sp. NPDC060194 TaxID=3347069 RepID=UPI00366124BE